MITDTYIIRRFRQVDENLELSLQRISLGPQPAGEVKNNETLSRFQQNLLKIKAIVEKISNSVQSSVSKGPVSIDYDVITQVIKELPIPMNDDMSQMETIVTRFISQYVMLICYYSLSNQCLSFLPAAYDTQRYYQEVTDSRMKSLLYSIQTSPAKLLNVGRQLYFRLGKMNELKHTDNISIDRLKKLGSEVFDELRPQFNRVLMVRNLQLVGLPIKSRKWASILLELPRAMIRDDLHSKNTNVSEITNEYTTKLGRLINDFQKHQKQRDAEDVSKLNALKRFLELPSESTLYDVAQYTKDFQTKVRTIVVKKPGKVTRYWPSALLLLTYGPASVIYLWESRHRVMQFLQENVVDFAKGLLYNWVYIPLKHVWSTVRHDEDSSIAVMSKGTLDSEMNSLTRMIVSFVNENSGTRIDDNVLIQQVEHGDLTRFMEIYETQLKHPIKNIVSGELVRSLLIQVQKTKVDGSLALDGIDKMLQSQQLVFGVVAISPALLIIYTATVCLFRLIKVGSLWSNIQQYKDRLSYSLNNLERLLNYSGTQQKDSSQRYLNQGLMTIEVCTVAKLGSTLVPKARLSEWLRDIEEIADSKLDEQAKLKVVDRIYHVYGKYF